MKLNMKFMFSIALACTICTSIVAKPLTQKEIGTLLAERDYIDNLDNPTESIDSEESINIYLNGARINSTEEPTIENGITLVPMRSIFEHLGFDINWDSKTNNIKAYNGKISIELSIGNKNVKVNGEQKTLSIAPKTINGSTMIPLRFISEAAGYNVKWDNDDKTIHITNLESNYKQYQPTSNNENYYEKLWKSTDMDELITYIHPNGRTETLTRGQWKDFFSSFSESSLFTDALQEKYGHFYTYWFMSLEERVVYEKDIAKDVVKIEDTKLTPDSKFYYEWYGEDELKHEHIIIDYSNYKAKLTFSGNNIGLSLSGDIKLKDELSNQVIYSISLNNNLTSKDLMDNSTYKIIADDLNLKIQSTNNYSVKILGSDLLRAGILK